MPLSESGAGHRFFVTCDHFGETGGRQKSDRLPHHAKTSRKQTRLNVTSLKRHANSYKPVKIA